MAVDQRRDQPCRICRPSMSIATGAGSRTAARSIAAARLAGDSSLSRTQLGGAQRR